MALLSVEKTTPLEASDADGVSGDVDAAAPVYDILIYNGFFNNSDGEYTNLTGNITGTNMTDFYDYSGAEYSIPPEEWVPVGLVYGFTLLFGIVGNSLVIFSVTRYQLMRSITNIFLLSLASADLLLVCVCIPVKFAAFLTFSWTFGEFICKGVHYLQNVSALCSVLTLTTMSMERYYAIRHPMRAKYTCTAGRAWRATFILWTLSLILAMPIIFQRIHKPVGRAVKAYWCVKDWESRVYSQLYEVYTLFLMLIIPLTIMTFAYVSIIRELWAMANFRSTMTRSHVIKRSTMNGNPAQPAENNGSSKFSWGSQQKSPGSMRFAFRSTPCPSPVPSSAHSTPGRHTERTPVFRKTKHESDDDKTKRQVIKMLVAVIVVFVVCWAPILINNTLTAFGYLHHLNYDYLKPMRQVFYLMAYANSCINPVIYGFMSKHFRKTFYHVLCTCLKKQRHTTSRGMLNRQASWQSRSTNIREFGDLELTSIDAGGCGNCSKTSV